MEEHVKEMERMDEACQIHVPAFSEARGSNVLLVPNT
jgi:hypothetical protein